MGKIQKKKTGKIQGDQDSQLYNASDKEGTPNRSVKSEEFAQDENANGELIALTQSPASATKNDNASKNHPKRKTVIEKAGNHNDISSEEADDIPSVAKKARKDRGKNSAAAALKDGPSPDSTKSVDEDNVEYEVEDIVDQKTERGKIFYLVRWKGYTADDDTWEPEATLSCPDLIAKFHKRSSIGNGKAGKGAKKNSGNLDGPTTSKNAAAAAAAAANKNKTKKSPGKKAVKPQSENQEYEVEKILNYSITKNGRSFHIRWKGYKAKHDTWEPESNLNCPHLIEKFMEKMKQQENLSFKELREEPRKTKRLVNETAPRTNLHNKIGRTSKRAVTKKRVFYGGDSDE